MNSDLKGEKMKIVIAPQNSRQTMEGWGTSLCWWANTIGKWTNQEKMNEICDLLFDAEKGLGMNIVRYNIGGGENPPNLANLREGANIPCYLDECNQWNWEVDRGQRKILKIALSKGADIAEVFSNAPPFHMTRNGSTSGADDRKNNLKEDQYKAFADFLTEVVKHFKEEWDISFRTLSIFNEPISMWWYNANNQEGCYFDTDHQIRILKSVIESFKEKGIKETTLSAPEGWSVFDSIYSYGVYSEDIKKFISQINTHAYFGDDYSRRVMRSVAKEEGKKLWMSEVSCGGTEQHNHEDMTGAVELANSICNYINGMGAEAWVYWQAVENEDLKLNHGLIHANFNGEETYWLTKQYFVFANFSRFIRRGAVIIDCGNKEIVAAVDEKARTLTVVAVNGSGQERELSFELSGMKVMDGAVEAIRTSVDENLSRIAEYHIDKGTLKVTLKGISVTTLLIRF